MSKPIDWAFKTDEDTTVNGHRTTSDRNFWMKGDIVKTLRSKREEIADMVEEVALDRFQSASPGQVADEILKLLGAGDE